MKHDKREVDRWCVRYYATRHRPLEGLTQEKNNEEDTLEHRLERSRPAALKHLIEKARRHAEAHGYFCG